MTVIYTMSNCCVYCNATTIDYESVFCRGCSYYIENMAHFEGEELEDELEKYGDYADNIFYFVRSRAYTV